MRFLPLVVACILVAGCHPPEYSLELAKVEHTPLAFDPTEEYEIGRWWFNGSQLLRLDATGGYVLYPGPNRYHLPVERGFWSKQSFAELRFAPYSTDAEWNRVAVTKNDGVIALHVPKLDAMYSIPGPPRVVEDELVGSWSGGGANLRLLENGRFVYTPTISRAGASGAPAIAIGHHGAWRVVDDRAQLFPDPQNMVPYEARLERDGETRRVIGLDAAGTTMRRDPNDFTEAGRRTG